MKIRIAALSVAAVAAAQIAFADTPANIVVEGYGVRLDCHSKLPQVRQAKLGRTNSGRSYIVKKSTYD